MKNISIRDLNKELAVAAGAIFNVSEGFREAVEDKKEDADAFCSFYVVLQDAMRDFEEMTGKKLGSMSSFDIQKAIDKMFEVSRK